MFINPASGRLTSFFGMRMHPTKKQRLMHWGIDIGNHADNKIKAAASGIVTEARVMGGYGNVVFIEHEIKGKKYVTVYAHLAKILVKVKQVVTQGHQIGIKGTTGESSGIHLHFEIHTGPWNNKYSNAVDPAGYILDTTIPLREGAKGPRVGTLQTTLAAAGHAVKVDNVYGPATLVAVKALQRAAGLTADGIVGPATFSILALHNPKPIPVPVPVAPKPTGTVLKLGAKGVEVTALQKALVAANFYPDKTAKNNGVDGSFGKATENALKRFQSIHTAAEVDGIYGPKTKAKLTSLKK